MKRSAWAVLLLLGPGSPSALQAATDPNTTVTLYVHGFEQAGAGRHGVYGDTVHVSAIDSIAALVGLPVASSAEDLAPNASLAVEYYGDTPPAYYSPADVADIAGITAQWNGGIPRYAMVVAKFIEHVLETSGARQVNVVSASFGSLVTRWMIEKDVEGLASRGAVARWLTAEGVLSGNWAASHDEFVSWVNAIDPLPVDVTHMQYDWVESHLHAPRSQADDPHYAGILIGQLASTDDSYLDGGLSALMAGVGDYQPNDGVQALADTYFREVTPRSLLLGWPPTLGLFHVNHYELSRHRGAWAQVATFLTQRRRVRIVMTQARVTDLHEVHQVFWDWRPAEVVFQSRVFSPAVAARWGIGDALSETGKEGAVAPLRRYQENGETQAMQQVVFDDLVLDSETQLRVDLHGEEIDYDARYGVFETIGDPYDELGSGSLMVSTRAPGTYGFTSASWSCSLSVSVVTYPFESLLGVADPRPMPAPAAITAVPNPHAGSVRLLFDRSASRDRLAPARVSVFDLTGRRVRRLEVAASEAVRWDGRDDAGVPLPAGVYQYRVEVGAQWWSGRSCLVR